LRTIVFGCVPDDDDDATREHVAQLCQRLSHLAGMSIEPGLFGSPAELAAAIGEGRVAIAWVSPALLLTSPHLRDAEPLVQSVREGVTTYHGALFVPPDSPIHTPTDLEGTRAGWVAETSAAGYLFPRLLLASYGLDPRKLFASEAFFHSHGGVARAVRTKQVDVGGTYVVFERGDPTRAVVRASFLDDAGMRTARVLLPTAPIPSDMIVASKALSAGMRQQVQRAFEGLDADAEAREPLRRVLGAEGFREFDPTALRPLREQIALGRELGLL
jgi:phosphonate transport system substrate-binding protein